MRCGTSLPQFVFCVVRMSACVAVSGKRTLCGMPSNTPFVNDPCGCRRNAAGDIQCHRCGEYVNVRCWNCRTPRGEGPCPTQRWVDVAGMQ